MSLEIELRKSEPRVRPLHPKNRRQFRSATLARNRPDLICLVILFLVATTASIYAFVFDFWLQTLDIATQFLSWYGYIGDRLATGQLPAWFPYDGSGEAIIGSPASGWMFLPVMVTFPFFEILTAYKLFIALHVFISGFGMYFFARKISLTPLPSLVAAISFALGPTFYGALTFSPPASQVLIFIPLAMLAAECALRAPRFSSIFAWSAVIGLCFSQMFIGSAPRVIYGIGFVTSWLLYRLLFTPPDDGRTSRGVLVRILTTGVIAGVFGAGFVAAAALPQLAYSAQSQIPHGDYSQVVNGDYASEPWTLIKIATQALSEPNLWLRPYLYGSGLLLLAFLAVLVARNRFGVPYFAVVSLILLDISWTGSYLRGLITTLPGLGTLVEHRPTSSVLFLAFTLPILAAAGCQWLMTAGHQSRLLLVRAVPLCLFFFIVSWLETKGPGRVFGDRQIWLAIGTTILFYVPMLFTRQWFPRPLLPLSTHVGVALAIAALMIPSGFDAIETLTDPHGTRAAGTPLSENDETSAKLDRMVGRQDPGTAAEFLQHQQDALQPFRFAPWPGSDDDLFTVFHHMDNVTLALMTHSRASRLGLQQVTSYNPTHLRYYVEYLETMNQDRQDYHTTSPLSSSLVSSQLLDMLNVRYIVVPRDATLGPVLGETHQLVYQDEEVSVFENQSAFPRAWVVHDVRPAAENPDYLTALNNSEIDGHQVAFVDGDLPHVALPGPADRGDTAIITEYAPETITLQTNTSSDGLLVLSEIYADGWNAYVDGGKVDIVRTNHTLRGVPLPAGRHQVILEYEPQEIMTGLAITGATGGITFLIWGWAIVDFRRRYVAATI